MTRRMRISRAGIELIKSFEGFYARTVRVDDEHWLIGYGHVRRSKDKYRVTRNEAEQILREYDLPPFEALVLENTFAPLHQGAFDALVSFAFNIGKEAFLESDVRTLINSGEMIAAAEALGAWRKAKIEGRTIVVDALVRRRAAEKAMFLGHPSGPAPAPSAMVRPAVDLAAKIMSPRERAVVIETSVEGDDAKAFPRPPLQERRATRDTIRVGSRPTERLVKRLEEHLGDDEYSPIPSAEVAIEGPTPEEITAAISELVNGVQGEAELQDVEDLPGIDLEDEVKLEPLPEADLEIEPYPESNFANLEQAGTDKRLERVLEAETDIAPLDLPGLDSLPIIDDLEPIDVAEEDIERALRVHEQMQAESRKTPIGTWGPFALFAVIGAGLFEWGRRLHIESGAANAQTELSPALVMIIIGAIMFFVMGYYFLRAILHSDND